MNTDIKSLGPFVWSIAELLGGDFKQSEYGKVILPFVVLRRLDCILEERKQAVVDMANFLPEDMDDDARDTLLSGAVGQDIRIYNLSRFTFASLKGQDAKDIQKNLIDYISKFSGNVRGIFLDKLLFTDQVSSFSFKYADIAEQAVRASGAVKERNRITRVQQSTEKSIDRLKEYRSALITAAVTGQIDVTTYAKSGTPDRRLDAIQVEMGA